MAADFIDNDTQDDDVHTRSTQIAHAPIEVLSDVGNAEREEAKEIARRLATQYGNGIQEGANKSGMSQLRDELIVENFKHLF